jgi:hypothetical protein
MHGCAAANGIPDVVKKESHKWLVVGAMLLFAVLMCAGRCRHRAKLRYRKHRL